MICDAIWGKDKHSEFKPGEQNTYLKENNITAITKGNEHDGVVPHQVMLSKEKTREELLARFDYKHCCVSYMPFTDKLFITKEAFNSGRFKRLVVNNEKMLKPYRLDKFH